MKRSIVTLVATVLALPLAWGQSADDIMARVDANPEPQSQRSTMTMVLVDQRNQQRVRQIQSQQMETETANLSLLFFLQPADVRGTGFLMFDYHQPDRDTDQWLWLPSLGRARRIAGSDQTGSFMGSDLSYADLSRRHLEDWRYQLLREEEVSGEPVWLIEATARDQSVVDRTGYQRSILYVRQDIYQLTRAVHYTSTEGLIKLMNIPAFEQHGDYWLPGEIQMVTQRGGRTEHRTLLRFSERDVNYPANPNDFTLNRLERGL
ncbi:MAG: outer membrane lipoprotein-sorting protein [Saccharospirillum sp.]|nr:outer membrane lipoprotein-sorting protein [Saccharospirillum sp.]